MNFQTIHKQRKFILAAVCCGIIALFLPWVTISIFGATQSTNGFHDWGIVAFIGYIIAGVIAMIGIQTEALEKNSWFLLMVSGATILLSIVIKLASSSGSLDGGLGLVDASFGMGVWVSICAAAGIILFGWLFKNPSDNFKSGFDNFRSSISIPSSSISNANNSGKSSATGQIIELEKLSKLKETGSITEEEYTQLKSKLI